LDDGGALLTIWCGCPRARTASVVIACTVSVTSTISSGFVLRNGGAMIAEDVRARIPRLFFAEHWKIGTIAV